MTKRQNDFFAGKFFDSRIRSEKVEKKEKYLGHFLGAEGAITFINEMANNPEQSAASLFPRAAGANRSIFYRRNSEGRRVARSLNAVYETLGQKFDRDIYEETGSVSRVSLTLRTPLPLPPAPPPPPPPAP